MRYALYLYTLATCTKQAQMEQGKEVKGILLPLRDTTRDTDTCTLGQPDEEDESQIIETPRKKTGQQDILQKVTVDII